MHQSSLKKFNEILDITTNGDYEAHTEDGRLTARVGTFDHTGIVYVFMTGISEPVDLYTNVGMMLKYIDLFDDPLEIRSSGDAILLYNDKVEVVLPMVAEENAKKSTKTLKTQVVYDKALVIDIPMADINAVFKASKKQDDAIIKFKMEDHLVIEVGKVKRKLKDFKGEPYEWCFKYDVIKRVIGHAIGTVNMTLPYDTERPVRVTYTTGTISVEGYMMRIFL